MSEKKRLARHVTVGNRTYGPGDDLPEDVAAKITNPKAWLAPDEAQAQAAEEARQAGTTSGHKLATAVNVKGRMYGPNDPVPDDVAAQIKNPKAWVGGTLPGAAKESPPAEPEPAKGQATDKEGRRHRP